MGATGVSRTAPLVITFSEGMDASLTEASFMDPFTQSLLPSSGSWNATFTVLTCTPTQPLPANKMIVWYVDGANLAGESMSDGGYFTTGGSAGESGTCSTNEQSSFTVGKGAFYRQTSAGAPTPDANAPYGFVACTTVACSNGSPSGVSVTAPNGALTNLMALGIPGHFSLPVVFMNPTALEGAYPNGDYIFNFQASPAMPPRTVNFPAGLVFPNAPHLTNFSAAQAVDPTQPFQLGWDAFQGGTADDCIYVEIYGGVFKTSDPATPGALNGLARSVVIPAGTFQPNQAYLGAITFYDLLLTTNAGALDLAYRSSTTEFSLRTGAGTTGSLVMTNAAWAGGAFSFEVISSPGQAFAIENTSTLQPGQWQTWLSTNSPAGRLRLSDPRAAANNGLFYRVRSGP
jgi:hypothetical protein